MGGTFPLVRGFWAEALRRAFASILATLATTVRHWASVQTAHTIQGEFCEQPLSQCSAHFRCKSQVGINLLHVLHLDCGIGVDMIATA